MAQGVPHADATRISHLPPVGLLFASFLGYNPIKELLGAARAAPACRPSTPPT